MGVCRYYGGDGHPRPILAFQLPQAVIEILSLIMYIVKRPWMFSNMGNICKNSLD